MSWTDEEARDTYTHGYRPEPLAVAPESDFQ